MFAEVILDLPGPELDRGFDYEIPAELAESVVRGCFVEAPFGAKSVRGWIVDLKETTEVPPQKVRRIKDVLTECGVLAAPELELARWIAKEYCASLREALALFLPPGSPTGETLAFVAQPTPDGGIPAILRSARQAEVYDYLLSGGEAVSSLDLRSKFGQAGLEAARALVRRGLVQVVSHQRSQVRAKTLVLYELAKSAEECAAAVEAWGPKAPQRSATLKTLTQVPEAISQSQLRGLGGSLSALRDLLRLGFVRTTTAREWRTPETLVESTPKPLLNPEQRRAVDAVSEALSSNLHRVFLLHGVTGSGKTEVYLSAAEAALERGKTALILVPEIALTPQTAARFRDRFGQRVAVLHSRLSAGERFDEWERVSSGEADIVLGARSAVFAPLKRLGLVVVDEEHEGSYKQEDAPRYHAVEVAAERARLHGAVALLGSATPSIETYHRALGGDCGLLVLRTRATGGTLPSVSIVDMRDELATGNRSMFSRRLHEGIGGRLLRGEQVILFLNRRGYARAVLCRSCGLTMECPHCGVALTLHASTGRVQCHYCDFSRRVPDKCPSCGSSYIRHFGVGTERVEEEVNKAFPGARVVRMDVDTTRRKGAHQQILDGFRRGEYDVLIGTQMVAKGLDFPNVTLVGVVAADSGLRLPDYRASERTFQLLAQVAGRSGRGLRAGEVVIQTYSPDHYAVKAAASHDYEGFYHEEIGYRRSLGYPPFGELILLTTSAVREEVSKSAAVEVFHAVEGILCGVASLLGPVPAPIARLRGRFRHQVLIKGGLPPGWREALKEAVRTVAQRQPEAVIQVSVRPQSLL